MRLSNNRKNEVGWFSTKRYSFLTLFSLAVVLAIVTFAGFSLTDEDLMVAQIFKTETPTTASDSTSASDATARPYNTPSFYGINLPNIIFPDARGTDGDVAMEKIRSELSLAGVEWVRTDVSPSLYRAFSQNTVCLTGAGLCDINKLEGFKILGVIDHVTLENAYQFGFCTGPHPNVFSPGMKDLSLATWEKLVDCVSKEFRGKVSAYEIWNEPTLPEFYRGYQDGTSRHYFNMLKIAYKAIKKNDPDAIVVGIGGALIYAGGENGPEMVKKDRDFSRALARMGGSRYVDAISVHAYGWGFYGGWVWDSFTENIDFHKRLWKKDVWVTETGHRTTDSGNQSEYLQRAFSLFINEGVSKVLWYALRDTPEGTFGIVDRPIHDFFKQFIDTPKSGLLRVTTDPAVEATITVNPVGLVRTWGIAWERIEKGIYTIKFDYPHKSINGRKVRTPSERELEIKANMTTVVTTDFTKGTVSTEYFWE